MEWIIRITNREEVKSCAICGKDVAPRDTEVVEFESGKPICGECDDSELGDTLDADEAFWTLMEIACTRGPLTITPVVEEDTNRVERLRFSCKVGDKEYRVFNHDLMAIDAVFELASRLEIVDS